mmetsp:Transcript_66969/g.216422  ORF Transcript_66969/g.216422 Transcript_66969/m.216422 type:complete len:225 (-) Transcript_66969:76-750(-)
MSSDMHGGPRVELCLVRLVSPCAASAVPCDPLLTLDWTRTWARRLPWSAVCAGCWLLWPSGRLLVLALLLLAPQSPRWPRTSLLAAPVLPIQLRLLSAGKKGMFRLLLLRLWRGRFLFVLRISSPHFHFHPRSCLITTMACCSSYFCGLLALSASMLPPARARRQHRIWMIIALASWMAYKQYTFMFSPAMTACLLYKLWIIGTRRLLACNQPRLPSHLLYTFL